MQLRPAFGSDLEMHLLEDVRPQLLEARHGGHVALNLLSVRHVEVVDFHVHGDGELVPYLVAEGSRVDLHQLREEVLREIEYCVISCIT